MKTPYEMRIEAGFHSVETLAAVSGVNKDTLRKYEKGRLTRNGESSRNAMKRVATALGVGANEYAAAVQYVSQIKRDPAPSLLAEFKAFLKWRESQKAQA